ncbi:MAG: hypothetical protein Q9228_007656 [Teloschistes exilis]
MNKTSSNSSSPSSGSSETASPDRSNAFQVLADGTQDLAALVGVLATDSVERYAVDYNRGYISTTAATLSLLGLLGYACALVKLGLGPTGCLKAGFDSRPLRSLFGIPDHDRLPSDVLHTVHYVERLKSDKYITWKRIETRKHTVNTMPILQTALSFDKLKPFLTMRSCRLTVGSGTFFIKHAYCSWVWVYAREQLPRRHSDWILSGQINHLKDHPSLKRKNHFAFIGKGYSYAIFDIKTLSGRLMGFLRAASFVCAFTAVVGYICQYVEVRQTTPGQAAKWLLIQGFLALIRIAIWIWDLRFDDFTIEKDDPEQRLHLSEAQLVMLWYTQVYPTQYDMFQLPTRKPKSKRPTLQTGTGQLCQKIYRYQHGHYKLWTSLPEM